MPGQHMSTIELAEELTALNFEQLSKDDVEQIQRLILDYSAVTLCGSVQPWGRMLTAWHRVLLDVTFLLLLRRVASGVYA